MRIYPEQLDNHLKAGLKPCYLLFGDEPLLKQEALDAIRATAAAQGFTERNRFATDDNPDWQQLHSSCFAMSLFANRQILELEMGEKTGKEWPERIRELASALHPDLLLILSGPRLSGAQLKAKWFDELGRLGVYVPLQAPEGKYFPRWMQNRCQQAKLQLQPDAVQFLCHAFEGNLLAAVQELEKLSLLGLPQPLSLATVQEHITRQNHFTPYQLIDTLLEGKSNRALRMLLQLRGEGVEAGLLCWALAKELELLLRLALSHQAGAQLAPLLEKERVWQSRHALLQGAIQRMSVPQLRQLLAVTAKLDLAVRRFEQEEAWLLLQSLALGFKEPAILEFALP